MLDRRPEPQPPHQAPKGVRFAKFPPDDDDAPAGAPPPPAAPAGGGASDDGDFKKGRFSPVAIIVGVVIAGLAGGAIYFGVTTSGDRMTVQQVANEKKNIFVLPQKDQIPKWRVWGANENEAALQQEAIIQLAWNDDPEGVGLATKALGATDHKVRGTAAQVLAHYGLPKAEGSKAALLKALEGADESDRPQIVWALTKLKEPKAFDVAMDQYRKGYLSKVERLGGGTAFDPEVLAGLVSLEQLAKLADDPSPSVRQLVATVLARSEKPEPWTAVLVKLVKDKDAEVGREAANGLGRIADEAARGPLLQALASADKDNRQKFLEALRDGIGGEGLVLALDSIKADPEETAWFQTKQIFDMLRDLADPRSADSLVKWIDTKKPVLHWQGEAGTRLAELGDVRAAKYIGERMLADPTKLYKQEKFWEANEGGHMSKNDLPRIVGTRMLADLAIMHPEARDALAAAAEAPVLAWLKDRPQPHANGLRFLAAIHSEKALKDMRDWSFPKKELPKEGQQGTFPMEFETAQSALRYLGWMKDEPSFPKLLDQFKRKKDKTMDITTAGLQGSGLSMLGMSLRAVGYGAAQGLAQWGDPKAIKPLIEVIEDENWNEDTRQAACEALAWCGDDKTMLEVAKKAKEFGAKKDPKKQLISACYAGALSLKPVPKAVPDLVELLTPEMDMGARIAIAKAIGVSGFDAAIEAKLFEKLQNPELRNAAAIALILGGNADTAARTVAAFGDWKESLDDLKDHYYNAFGYWSDEDFTRGTLYRWVANAIAISHVKVKDVPQEWAVQRLQGQFDNLKLDNGPHSETRVVLRYRLFKAAKSEDAAARSGAITTLKFMKEKGTLMALRHEKGETGELAKKAFFELMNPKALAAEKLPEKPGEKKSMPGQ